MDIIPVACDPGNNTIKVVVNNRLYSVDTLIKKSFEARMVFGTGDVGEPKDFLDVDIASGGSEGNFYVGRLANKGDGNQESLGGFKSENGMLKVAALTSIAYALVTEYPEPLEFNIALGTGLPVREFFLKNEKGIYDYAKVLKYRQMLSGTHTVAFNSTLFNRKKVTLHIEEQKVEVLPEGYAALLTLISSEGGILLPQYRKPNVNILLGDIGGGSSDFSGFSNGNYLQEAMFGFDTGINEAQDKICEQVKSQLNLNRFTRSELNQHLFDPELNGIVETNKGKVDINTIKTTYYKPLVDKILYQFKKNLQSNRFDESRIHHFFWVGGGSKELGGLLTHAVKEDVPNTVIAPSPMDRNVRAYYRAVAKTAVPQNGGTDEPWEA